MTAAELAPAASALTQAELAEQPAERFLGAHLAALRVAAVVLAHRTMPRRASSTRPRDVWQVLAEVAPEYAEWAGFFAASALKRRAVQAGAVALVGTREADDLLRDVRLFHDRVAARLRRASVIPANAGISLVELVETSPVASAAAERGASLSRPGQSPAPQAPPLSCRDTQHAEGGQVEERSDDTPDHALTGTPPTPLHGHVATEPITVPASPTTVIPADAGISKPPPDSESKLGTVPSVQAVTVIPANAGISRSAAAS